MKKQKERRLVVIQVLVILLMAIIIGKLFSVMISQGDYYRDLSDNRKVKEVDEIASRGNIYDRNGKILATSIPSFAVQIYKDQLLEEEPKKRTRNLAELVNILEADGVNYTDDFALKLNSFVYKRDEDYFILGQMPTEVVVSTLIDNNLVDEFLTSVYKDDNIKYETMSTALLALKKRGIDIPANVSQQEGKLKVSYRQNSKNKLKSIGYSENDNPIDVVVDAVGNDRSVLLSILQNSNARVLAYDILKSNDLLGSETINNQANDVSFINTRSGDYGVIDKFTSRTMQGYMLDVESEAKNSDILMTSGLGGVYPYGIYIGTISNVSMSQDTLRKNITVDSPVDFSHIYRVLVLKGDETYKLDEKAEQSEGEENISE